MRRTVEGLFSKASPAEIFTLPQLAERLRIAVSESLVTALADLTKDKVVDQIFRVESPKNRGGIGDFERIEDIPDQIEDWRQGRLLIPVTPRMVRVLFRKHLAKAAPERGE